MTFKTFTDYMLNAFNGEDFNQETAFNLLKDYSSNLKYSYEKIKLKYCKLYKDVYLKVLVDIGVPSNR